MYNNLQDVGTDWGTETSTYKMAQMIFAQSPNILSAGGYLMVAPFKDSEDLDDAITRLSGLVYFAGVMTTTVLTDDKFISAGTTAQGLDCMLFVPSNDASEFDDNGLFDKIAKANLTHTKSLYYGGASADNALKFCAGYASRMMSVDFNAQNSTNTLNLKDIVGLEPDGTITTALLQKAKTSGVDIYPNIGGIAKVLSNPIGGLFFDSVYNRIWFKKRAQVSYFNGLAGTAYKIPQTETGMEYLKSALRECCELSVYNGFLAPNEWKSADTFGNPDDFRRNIREFGYFVYSAPISKQSLADRKTRKAPVIQIAGKEAGAIHSGSIILNFEQ